MRKLFFKWLFNRQEQTAIINALYRRKDDCSSYNVNGELQIRTTCSNLAKELMS